MAQGIGFIANSEFNRFGLISVVILLVGCLGGFAVGLGAVENIFALTFVVIPTMATLSMILAVAPMKYILSGAAISIMIDILLIGYYLIA